MKNLCSLLFAFTTLLFWSNAPALAQRGQGRGSAGHSVGSRPSVGSDSGHPRNAPSTDRPASNPDRAAGRRETKPDSGQRDASEHLAQSPKLSSKIKGIFPAGTDLTQAAQGFKSLGDFVAAAHTSHNLNIPFSTLKTRMVNGQKLGDAIHELKPDADHRAEERKAREQARKDLQETGAGT